MDLSILVISIIGNISLGLLVYFKNPKSVTNLIFASLTVSLILMLIANHFSVVNNNSNALLTSIRLVMFFSSLVSYFYLLLVLVFPKPKIEQSRNPLILVGFLTLVTMLVAVSPFMFTGIKLNGTNVQPTPGPGIALFALVTAGSAIFALVKLLQRAKKSTGNLKLQLNFILLGTSLMFGFIILTIFLPVTLFNFSLLAPLLPLYTLMFVGASAYAIIRHKLLDIRLVVARAVAYSLLATVIFVGYVFATILATSFLLKTKTPTNQVVLYGVLTLLFAYTFQPLRRLFTNITDKIFFKQDYDQNNLLAKLTKVMAETILIDDIAHKLLNALIFEMRISRGAFVLTDAGKVFVTETQGFKEQPTYSEKDIFSIQALDKTLIFEDVEESATKELMRKLNVTVVIPLKTQVDHVGVLLLGEKASGEIYSDKDIKVLEIFAPEAAISFENAKSVERIRRFNITLKEQILKATTDLKVANEQLKQLDKLKDEFLSIASHDLRTPMTAIKSYLWMAVNNRAGELNPTLKRYLDISYKSSERMITMINDLLSVSRIEAGRVQMEFSITPLKAFVDQVFAEIAGRASEKGITLKYEEEDKLPEVILDKQRFPEVLQNLVGNAIKFTPEKGQITVRAKASKEKGFVEIAVIDTGVGIPKEEQDKLFTKFGRMQSAYTATSSTGGTGLGLYITKNFIELHGGKIWLESEVGKGTSFIFTLKISDQKALDEMNAENAKKQITPAPIPVMKP